MTKIIYCLIVLMQVFLFNHLDFSTYLFPQIFIVLLISMPVYWNKSAQITAAFFLGLMIDFFVSTPGIHASACLWLVLIRIGLLQTLDTSQLLMDKKLFSTYTVGNATFFKIASVLVLFYHVYIFLLDNIGNFNAGNYLLTVLVSTMFAMLIIALIQLVFYREINATR